MTHVLIIGGGVAGTAVANGLTRRNAKLDVTVAGSHPDHLFQPAYLTLPFTPGRGVPARDERSLLHPRVQFVVERLEAIDLPKRRVRFETGTELAYDWLVLATGSRLAHDHLEGSREGNYNFHCPKSAQRLAPVLADFKGGHIVVGATRLPYKCPPSPLEFTFLLDEWLCRRGLRKASRISYVYPHSDVFPLEPVARMVRPMLEERGVQIHTGFVPTAIDPARRVVHSNGRTLEFDLLVLVPAHVGIPKLKPFGITDDDGWVLADAATLKVTDRIYALGDVAKLPCPKSGAAAHAQAPVVVENILAEIRGDAPTARYDGRAMCFMETGGGRASLIQLRYASPPRASKPNRLAYWRKQLFRRLYFHLVKRF